MREALDQKYAQYQRKQRKRQNYVKNCDQFLNCSIQVEYQTSRRSWMDCLNPQIEQLYYFLKSQTPRNAKIANNRQLHIARELQKLTSRSRRLRKEKLIYCQWSNQQDSDQYSTSSQKQVIYSKASTIESKSELFANYQTKNKGKGQNIEQIYKQNSSQKYASKYDQELTLMHLDERKYLLNTLYEWQGKKNS